MAGYRILCVDDEHLALSAVARLCREQNPENTVSAYISPTEALAFARENPIDVALLDIDMPVLDGLTLARELIALYPRLNVIFVTASAQYALDAFRMNSSGYLMKPVSAAALRQQFEVLRFPLSEEKDGQKDVFLRCFGNFDVYFRGDPVRFLHAKTKELLAYLVDRRGAFCSNKQIAAALWEDAQDHASYLKQLKKDLLSSLGAKASEPIFACGRGYLALKPDTVSCDYFDFFGGNTGGFHGEYMEQYPWAQATRQNLLRRKNGL